MRKVLFLTSIIPGVPTPCRYCGSADVRPSKGVHFSARHRVYRCNTCRAHYKVARTSFRDLLPVMGYVLVGLLFAVLAAGIYVSTTQVDDLKHDSTIEAH